MVPGARAVESGRRRSTHRRWSGVLALCGLAAVALVRGQQAAVAPVATPAERVDAVFARWDKTTTPGCAVGVGVKGRTVLSRAYGMADLEHDVRNTPETIFEAGSVTKQFTAAAVLLLAREGKLSLDDDARKYLPEIPAYQRTITVRHLLQHTSGLRDWGNVAAFSGWPRTTRAYTHAHVLDIISRQQSLNYPPGDAFSYTNSGYNLAAMLVSRLAGAPFAEFTRTRLFEPLGMTRTSWRDDYRRIVKGRAIAYDAQGEGFETVMPFEDVHGNGGLLTTVGDLLRWNENFVHAKVGGPEFVAEQQTPGHLTSGRAIDYGLGLYIGRYKGLRQVYHSGATAGYRAHLIRFPDEYVSVSVLCNVGAGNAGQYAYQVADVFLADRLKPESPPAAASVAAPQLDRLAGLYRSTQSNDTVSLVRQEQGLRVENGPPLRPLSATRFLSGSGGAELEFGLDPEGRARSATLSEPNGNVSTFDRVERAQPTAAQLEEYRGTYTSDEAETSFRIEVDEGTLVMRRRPDSSWKLAPLYADGFDSPVGGLRFVRDPQGRVAELSVSNSRVWDIRFRRVE